MITALRTVALAGAIVLAGFLVWLTTRHPEPTFGAQVCAWLVVIALLLSGAGGVVP